MEQSDEATRQTRTKGAPCPAHGLALSWLSSPHADRPVRQSSLPPLGQGVLGMHGRIGTVRRDGGTLPALRHSLTGTPAM